MQCEPHAVANSEKSLFSSSNPRFLPKPNTINVKHAEEDDTCISHNNDDNIGSAIYDNVTQDLVPPKLKKRLEKEKDVIASYSAIRFKEYVRQQMDHAIALLGSSSPPPPRPPSPYSTIDTLPKHCSTVDDAPLPPYSCSLYKSGNLTVKQERGKDGGLCTDRSWKKCHLELRGTLLCINSRKKCQPLYRLSMQGVQAGVALDYKKYRNVLRIRMPDGWRFLLRTKTDTDMISWIEHLQASVNISRDFDTCSMPRFLTVARSTDRLQGTIVNLLLSTGCRTLVGVCSPNTTQ